MNSKLKVILLMNTYRTLVQHGDLNLVSVSSNYISEVFNNVVEHDFCENELGKTTDTHHLWGILSLIKGYLSSIVNELTTLFVSLISFVQNAEVHPHTLEIISITE